MRIYPYVGALPESFAEDAPDMEFIYDEEGRVTHQRGEGEAWQHFYGADGQRIRTSLDYPEGLRQVTEYQYDPEGGLVHIHWEEQRERYGKWRYIGVGSIFNPDNYFLHEEYVFEPTGNYYDEWFSWSKDGLHLTRTKEQYEGDDVTLCVTYEDYSPDGHILMERIVEPGSGTVSMISYLYGKDGHLSEVIHRSRSGENGKKIRTLWRDEYDNEGERVIARHWRPGVTTRISYEDDNEGNWIRMIERDTKGNIELETARIIEYW